MTAHDGAGPSRALTIGLWIMRILMAALFLFGCYLKLSGQPAAIEEFEKVGLGQWFRLFTGFLEIVGSLAIMSPRFSPLGALILLAVDVGAFVAQVTVLHDDWIHTVVAALILIALVYLQRGRLQGLLAPAMARS